MRLARARSRRANHGEPLDFILRESPCAESPRPCDLAGANTWCLKGRDTLASPRLAGQHRVETVRTRPASARAATQTASKAGMGVGAYLSKSRPVAFGMSLNGSSSEPMALSIIASTLFWLISSSCLAFLTSFTTSSMRSSTSSAR